MDLSAAAEWVRFLEIHYDREGSSSSSGGGEVTVVMVPSVSALATLMPSPENWPVREPRALFHWDHTCASGPYVSDAAFR